MSGNAAVEQPVDECIPQPEAAQPERFEHRVVKALRVRREHAGRGLRCSEPHAPRVDEAHGGSLMRERLAGGATDDPRADNQDVGHAQRREWSIQPSLMNRPKPRYCVVGCGARAGRPWTPDHEGIQGRK